MAAVPSYRDITGSRSGGKIVRARRARSRKNPYERPGLSNLGAGGNPSWISRFIFSPTLTIASGAGKLLSSVFVSDSDSSSSDSDSGWFDWTEFLCMLIIWIGVVVWCAAKCKLVLRKWEVERVLNLGTRFRKMECSLNFEPWSWMGEGGSTWKKWTTFRELNGVCC